MWKGLSRSEFLREGAELCERQQWPQAVRRYEAAAAYDRADLHVAHHLRLVRTTAAAHEAQQTQDRAEIDAAEALRQEKDTLLADANTKSKEKDWLAAVELYEKALELNPSDESTKAQLKDALVADGNIKSKKKDWFAAVEVYTKVLELEPSDESTRALLSKVQLQLQQKNQAEATVEATHAANSLKMGVLQHPDLWPFTNIVKRGWIRVEAAQQSGKWRRRWLQLAATPAGHAAGEKGILTVHLDDSENSLANPTTIMHVCDLQVREPKTERTDSPHTFRIDDSAKTRDSKVQKLIIAPDLSGQAKEDWEMALQDTKTRDAKLEWMNALRTPHHWVHEQDERRVAARDTARTAWEAEQHKVDEFKHKDRANRELIEKKRAAAAEEARFNTLSPQQQTEELAVKKLQAEAEEAKSKRAREKQLVDFHSAQSEEAARRRKQYYDDDSFLAEYPSPDERVLEQRRARDWQLEHALELERNGEFDAAREALEVGLAINVDDVAKETEALAGWISSNVTSDKDAQQDTYTRQWWRLVAGGTIYVYDDNRQQLTMQRLQRQLRLEKIALEGDVILHVEHGLSELQDSLSDPSVTQPAPGWANAFVRIMSGGWLSVFKDDPGATVSGKHSEKALLRRFMLRDMKIYTELEKGCPAPAGSFRIEWDNDTQDSLLIQAGNVVPREQWLKILGVAPPLEPVVVKEAELPVLAQPASPEDGVQEPTWESQFFTLLAMPEGHAILQVHRSNPAGMSSIARSAGMLFSLQCTRDQGFQLRATGAGAAADGVLDEFMQKVSTAPHVLELHHDRLVTPLIFDTEDSKELKRWTRLIEDPLAKPLPVDDQQDDFLAYMHQFKDPRKRAALQKGVLRCRPQLAEFQDSLGTDQFLMLYRMHKADGRTFNLTVHDIAKQKWLEVLRDCPPQKGEYKRGELLRQLELIPAKQKAWDDQRRVDEAMRREQARRIAELEEEERLYASMEKEVKGKLGKAAKAYEKQAEKLARLEVRRQERLDKEAEKLRQAEEKIARERAAQLDAEYKAVEAEANALLAKMEADAKRHAEEAVREQARLDAEAKAARERIAALEKQVADTLAAQAAEEARNKFYCGWIAKQSNKKSKGLVGSRRFKDQFAVLIQGCFMLFKHPSGKSEVSQAEKDELEDPANAAWWEEQEPNDVIALVALRRLRMYHNAGEGEVMGREKRVKKSEVGFRLDSQVKGKDKTYYLRTETQELAERWVRNISVVRCVVAARENMMWLVQNPMTLEIKYEFLNPEELKHVREREEAELQDELRRVRRKAALEERRRAEVQAQQAQYDEEEAERLAREAREAADAEKQRLREQARERDKIIYSYPAPDQFELEVQPLSVLLPALPIIRSKAGWLTKEVVKDELIPNKNKKKQKYMRTVTLERYFCVMWRHPQLGLGGGAGAYDMLQYPDDNLDLVHAPVGVEHLRFPIRYRAVPAGRKDMPNGFCILSKTRKDSPTRKVYFDAKTSTSCERWLKFLCDGPKWDGVASQ
eukprot:COSAG01_NODE_628_length_14690_cov_1156.936947_8_plen_1503_part_00